MKDDLMIFLGVAFCIIVLTFGFAMVAINNKPTYEYGINGQIGTSKDCYQTKKGYCYCKIGTTFEKVDNYYVVD